MPSTTPDPLQTAIDATKEAGKILLGYFKSDYEIHDKGFRNPVTTADYAANDYLEQTLREAFPEDGWLSEETVDTPERLTKDRVWVVDPLDGTKEFIEGVPQWVVSVALTEKGRPIIGILFNPVSDELFVASEGNGATYNGQKVTVSQKTNFAEMDILNSRSETYKGLWKPFKDHFKNLVAIGSVAYKLGLTSTGKHDMFATLRPKNEWDVCAGDCILREAGGELRELGGELMTYNKEDVLTTPGLVGGTPEVVASFLELYRSGA